MISKTTLQLLLYLKSYFEQRKEPILDIDLIDLIITTKKGRYQLIPNWFFLYFMEYFLDNQQSFDFQHYFTVSLTDYHILNLKNQKPFVLTLKR